MPVGRKGDRHLLGSKSYKEQHENKVSCKGVKVAVGNEILWTPKISLNSAKIYLLHGVTASFA
jgi:hypothetical protein